MERKYWQKQTNTPLLQPISILFQNSLTLSKSQKYLLLP